MYDDGAEIPKKETMGKIAKRCKRNPNRIASPKRPQGGERRLMPDYLQACLSVHAKYSVAVIPLS